MHRSRMTYLRPSSMMGTVTGTRRVRSYYRNPMQFVRAIALIGTAAVALLLGHAVADTSKKRTHHHSRYLRCNPRLLESTQSFWPDRVSGSTEFYTQG